MGNIGSNSVNNRNRRHGSARRSHPPPPPPVTPQPEIIANRFVYSAPTPYPSQYPNPNPPPYYQYAGYYPPPPPTTPVPMPAAYDHHHRMGPHLHMDPAWMDGRYPCGPVIPPPPLYVEHQKTLTVRNDVNIKKETLGIQPDEENPGRFLVAFTFDATIPGR